MSKTIFKHSFAKWHPEKKIALKFAYANVLHNQKKWLVYRNWYLLFKTWAGLDKSYYLACTKQSNTKQSKSKQSGTMKINEKTVQKTVPSNNCFNKPIDRELSLLFKKHKEKIGDRPVLGWILVYYWVENYLSLRFDSVFLSSLNFIFTF